MTMTRLQISSLINTTYGVEDIQAERHKHINDYVPTGYVPTDEVFPMVGTWTKEAICYQKQGDVEALKTQGISQPGVLYWVILDLVNNGHLAEGTYTIE